MAANVFVIGYSSALARLRSTSTKDASIEFLLSGRCLVFLSFELVRYHLLVLFTRFQTQWRVATGVYLAPSGFSLRSLSFWRESDVVA